MAVNVNYGISLLYVKNKKIKNIKHITTGIKNQEFYEANVERVVRRFHFPFGLC